MRPLLWRCLHLLRLSSLRRRLLAPPSSCFLSCSLPRLTSCVVLHSMLKNTGPPSCIRLTFSLCFPSSLGLLRFVSICCRFVPRLRRFSLRLGNSFRYCLHELIHVLRRCFPHLLSLWCVPLLSSLSLLPCHICCPHVAFRDESLHSPRLLPF
jgi:hypothetical protein